MKKTGICIISLGLVCAIILCLVSQLVWSLPKNNGEGKKPFIYGGIDENESYYGFDYISAQSKAPDSYQTQVSYKDTVGISSYSVGDNLITYEFCGGKEVVYNVYFNNKLIHESVYCSGDMLVDMVFSGDNSLYYNYGKNGLLSSVTVNDGTVELKRDESQSIIKVVLNGKDDHIYNYGDGYVITDEHFDNQSLTYRYDSDGYLITESDIINVQKSDNTLKLTQNGINYEYDFDYIYSGNSYVTSVRINGQEACRYTYLNGSITSKITPEKTYYYIVDYSGNYLGYVCDGEFFMFVYTGNGSVYGILNSEGEAVFLNAGAYGDYYTTAEPNNSAYRNSIVYTDAVIDTTSKNICIPNGIIMPREKKKIIFSNGSIAQLSKEDSLLDKNEKELKLSSLNADLLFKERVIDNAVNQLKSKGLYVAPYVEVLNGEGETVMTADLYTLDYSDSFGSTQNLLNGNQIYTVMHRDARISCYREREELLNAINENSLDYRADYYGEFPVKKGSMNFSGQFIYLGYLITYGCNGDGIIYYSINEACRENYKDWNNIYDYDNLKYVNYSEISFSTSIWDYTEIIPGMNQEHYNAIEGFLDEMVLMQGQLEQDQLEYIDESFFSAEYYNDIGDTLELYANAMTEDQMIVLSSDGNLTIKALPFWDAPSVQRNFVKIVGTIVVSVVVATVITVVIPGSGAVVMPVLHCAMKSAVKGAVKSFFLSAVTHIDWTDLENTDLNTLMIDSLQNVGNSFMMGAVSGTFNGMKRAWKYNKATDGLFFKSDKKRMQYLNKTYDSGLIYDDMYASMEYERYKISIESGLLDKKGYEYILTNEKSCIIKKIVKKATKSFIKQEIEDERVGENEK